MVNIAAAQKPPSSPKWVSFQPSQWVSFTSALTAKERGFLTFGWAFSPEQAATLVAAGADFIGAMAGISTNTVPLDSFADEIQRLGEISDTAKRCRTSCLVLGHGGPFTTASAIGELLTQTSLDGFATGSNIERDVVHLAVKSAVASLKQGLA